MSIAGLFRDEEEQMEIVASKPKMKPFDRGWLDADAGRLLKDCPFPVNSRDYLAWHSGWYSFHASLRD